MKSFSVVILIFVFSVMALSSWNYVDGYSFVGITNKGVEFPILSTESTYNATGTGDSVWDGMGVYLTIDNIGTNGVVYFGEDNNPGSQTDIRQYVGVDSNDNWAIVITDDDSYESLVISEFGVQYEYQSGSLNQVVNVVPNILGYSQSRSIAGSTQMSINDGIVFSGAGEVILKLNDYQNQNLFLSGNVDDGTIKIITSDHDLINDPYIIGTGFLTHTANIDPGTNSFSITAGIDSTHTGVLTHDGHGYQDWYDGRHFCYVTADTTWGTANLVANEASGCHYIVSGVQTTTTLVKTNNVDHYTITGDSTTPTLMDMGNYYWGDPMAFGQYNDNFSFKLYDTLPSTQLTAFSGGSFEQVLAFPSEQTYMYVKLNSGSITIKGEAFDPESDVYLEIDGLLPDIAYDISKSGIVGVVGKTSSTGMISLLYEDVDFGIYTSPGGILKLYPDSISYIGDFGIGMIDLYNGGIVELPVGEDLAYIPQNYVRWVFPVEVKVSNVRVDDVHFDYLNRNYTKNEAVLIPVIPSSTTIYATINDIDGEILMKDVSTTTQITQVPQESSTTSDHSTDGATSTSSNISVSTFETATHTGMMSVNFDFKVGGSADYTMDSAYTGGFTEHTSCRINYSTERLNQSCNTSNIPSNPESISNIDTLTVEHQEQLTMSLNNGQLSQIAVEVDIVKNMQYVDTILVYTSNSAQASVTSTLDIAGYGASNQVYITYPLTSISENIAIPVTVGDMMEFVVRVNLEVSGAPAPSSEGATYSSYVQATTEFGGGTITVGMS